jgi:hypothetical protein
MSAKRTAAKRPRKAPNRESVGREAEARAFDDLCETFCRSHLERYANEYRRTRDPRFAWLAWSQLSALKAVVPQEPTPDWLRRYIDTVADRICSLDGGNLGKGLVLALGFKPGRAGSWSIPKAREDLNRDHYLARIMSELIAGEYSKQTDAAANQVREEMAKPFVENRYHLLNRLRELSNEDLQRFLAPLSEAHPLRHVKNLTELRAAIDRQVAEYKKTVPSPSTVQRAYKRVFGKSPTS